MSFSEAELDRWATWLDLETSYSVKKLNTNPVPKFNKNEQLRTFNIGVARGDSSWASSASNYLKRATYLLHEEDPRAVARMVQCLGKSAHNHIACGAIAKVCFGESGGLLTGYFDLQEEWRKAMRAGVAEIRLNGFSASDQLIGFEELQRLQDKEDSAGFMDCLKALALPIHAGFIALSEELGWQQPGLSSTEDTQQWTSQGDELVMAIIGANDEN